MVFRDVGTGNDEVEIMTKPKCYGCGERKVGCHASCVDYKLYNEERKYIAEKRREESGVIGYREEKFRRIAK